MSNDKIKIDYDAMAAEVYQHALDNYDADGWDYVVETLNKYEIANTLRKHAVSTTAAAIAHYAQWAKALSDYRDEIRNTEW